MSRRYLDHSEAAESDLESVVNRVGSCRHGSIRYLTRPEWDEVFERWTCLANVAGSLCLVEVKLWVESEKR